MRIWLSCKTQGGYILHSHNIFPKGHRLSTSCAILHSNSLKGDVPMLYIDYIAGRNTFEFEEAETGQ